jgi:hypothetical protein
MRTILNIMIAGVMATAAAGATGCYSNDDVEYSGQASYDSSPDLVDVSPGVQVIADYDEPVFFSDGLYWRYSGGIWYSSGYWGGGWAVGRPPYGIAHIDRPYAYAHYRPVGWHPRAGARVVGRTEVRGRGEVRGEVRENRAEVRREPVRTNRAPVRATARATSHRK